MTDDKGDAGESYTDDQVKAAVHSAPRGVLDHQAFAIRVGDAGVCPAVIEVPQPAEGDTVEAYEPGDGENTGVI